MVELEATRRAHRHHLHGPGLRLRHGLLLAQAGLGDGGDVAGELPRRGLRRAAHVGGRQLAEAGQVEQALDDVGLGGEELLAAQAQALDQAVHEQVGARRVQRRGGGAVELEEAEDPVAGLRRDLRGLGCRHQGRDHVDLAPPRDLGAAGDVHRAQVDRLAGERAHDRPGVARVGEQPQPREHVADLGPLEERRRPDDPERQRALLQGHRDGLALAAHGADEHADRLGLDALVGDQPLDLDRDALGLSALAGAAPRHDLAARRAAHLHSGPGGARGCAAGSAGTARGGRPEPRASGRWSRRW